MDSKTRLYKTDEGKKIFGVCAGLADSFNLDVTLIRFIWLIAVCCLGTGILLYIICALIFPNKDSVSY